MNTSKTHPLNVSYLVVGLVFLGISGSWALRTSGAVDADGVRWLVPAVLMAAGAIGLVAFAAKGISHGRRDQDDETSEVSAYDPYLAYERTEQTVQTDTDDEGDHR